MQGGDAGREGRFRDEKVAGLCSDLYLRRQVLWTFAREPGVEPASSRRAVEPGSDT